MGSSREIITFQLGNFSNYIGAHWWNIQESYFQYNSSTPSEINHDVLFREGKTLMGQTTFTPRLILVDKADNFIHLPVLSESSPKPSDFNTEGSPVLLNKQMPDKHPFIKDLEKIENGQNINLTPDNYNFDSTVRSWCDFLRTRYHPRSVCSFQTNGPTDIFHSGMEVYKGLEENFVEKIRSYMEECDNLQGFQVLVDAGDAFGGYADSTLTFLQDEYSSKPVFTLPIVSGYHENPTPLDDVKRTINIFLTYQKLTENSSLLVPLGTMTSAWRALGPPIRFPNIDYNHRNLYQTSAILASFLDTVTLKYRLREDYNYLCDLASGLNYCNKNMCAASISLPFPIAADSYLLDTLENLDDSLPLWSQLTPGCNIDNDTIFYQKITVRGIPMSKLRNPNVTRQNSRAYTCSSTEELIHLYLSYRLTTISEVKAIEIPLYTSLPFPRIFSRHVTPSGSIDDQHTRMENFDVTSCPVVTGIHCCKGVSNMIDSLHRCVKNFNIKRFHHFLGTHMDVEEFNECLEKLLSLRFDYVNDIEMR